MPKTLIIRSSRYHKPFVNSDNPCCWQIERVCEDIEAVLDGSGLEYVSMTEDWGASYTWRNRDGVEHSLMIECTDVDLAEYELQYWATRKTLFGLGRAEVTESSDFQRILPSLMGLNQTS